MIKNNRIIKYISSLLAAAIIICSFSIGFFAYGDDLIAINSANFPDNSFRKIVASRYINTNGDEFLSSDEIAAVTEMEISGYLEDVLGEDAFIEDLTGIEKFTSTTVLRCGGVGLTSLDVTQMPQLVELTCQGNELSSLDLSSNVNLEILNCSSNELTELGLNSNVNLKTLDCHNNKMTSLDVSKLTKLETFRCYKNELTQLDLKNNLELKTLNCTNNHIAELDLSANTSLGAVTNYEIGSQYVNAKARFENGVILVGFTFNDASKIADTSVDRVVENENGEVTVLGYDGIDFVAYNVNDIKDGIDYSYNIGLGSSENMSVHIDLERDFYQVNFYTSAEKDTLIGYDIVNNAQDAQAPQITDFPQCKVFSEWSEPITNITKDMDVYAVWKDSHNYTVTDFSNGFLTVSCSDCDVKDVKLRFMDMINARRDSDRYQSVADVNSDGIINVKDFAKLTRMFGKA